MPVDFRIEINAKKKYIYLRPTQIYLIKKYRNKCEFIPICILILIGLKHRLFYSKSM